MNSSSPAASIPSVERLVSGEICGEPHDHVHVREEEKGGSPARKKEQDGGQNKQKKSQKKLDDQKLKQVVKEILVMPLFRDDSFLFGWREVEAWKNHGDLLSCRARKKVLCWAHVDLEVLTGTSVG
ncbi:uncharacterized protein LOC124647884 [Lolium rigidum]|uniref:uncharacterized protein LOC124647884 n=1 Tax=Lolium rigidum TaxID=89674 RepID=UPI001F5D9B9E|nr:uncharacterized protein LOC124647884 [Lolium rigidum]